jgi:hypothetical protein
VQTATEIIALGTIDHQGEILLNYVHPAHRFLGASKPILKSLETKPPKPDWNDSFWRAQRLQSSFRKSVATVLLRLPA